MLAGAVVQANQCSSGGECPSDDEPKRAVLLLQQKLQMNVLKDGDEASNLGVANRSAKGIDDYECDDTNRAQYTPWWKGDDDNQGAYKTPELEERVAAEVLDASKSSNAMRACGRASPRCVWSYKDRVSGPWMPCCEKRQYHELLRWFHNVVQSHIGDEFWYALVYGTLLGSTRQGEMIDWDTDLDIAVPKEGISWLEGLLKEAGAKEDPPYYVTLDLRIPPLRLHMSRDNAAHVDIWPTEVDPEYLKIGGHAPSPNFGFFPLQQCPFGNRQFPCPNNKEKFLQYKYGDSWQQSGTCKDNCA